MPRASVAVSLRAQILASASPAVDVLARWVLLQDEDLEGPLSRLGEDDAEAGKAAMLLLRNARAGRALRGAAGYPSGQIEAMTFVDPHGNEKPVRRPGVGMKAATDMMDALIVWAVRKHGLTLDRGDLFGVTKFGRLERPGLLQELAFASDLRFRGDSLSGSGEALAEARGEGMAAWLEALDDTIISPDELQLVLFFCLLHTFRPF